MGSCFNFVFEYQEAAVFKLAGEIRREALTVGRQRERAGLAEESARRGNAGALEAAERRAGLRRLHAIVRAAMPSSFIA